ncbi:hypothetical protein HMPREF1536_00716, partial [Parabacteroides gordonii MS-1 = DSM 23371]
RRSLSNAGAKVVDYYIHSKLFTNYFLFIFSRQALYYNVRIKEKKKSIGLYLSISMNKVYHR